jgi:hypothetical protein
MKLVKEVKAVLCEYTQVKGASWDCPRLTGTLKPEARGEKTEEVQVDHVIYATGVAVGFGSIAAMKPLLEAHPIRIVGGMPCLTSELMWNEEVPFFVTGRLSGLRLGPVAGNLEGARVGAEFVAGKIAEVARKWGEADSSYESEETHGNRVDMRLGLRVWNQFDALVDSEE